jgi:hypothetical protein
MVEPLHNRLVEVNDHDASDDDQLPVEGPAAAQVHFNEMQALEPDDVDDEDHAVQLADERFDLVIPNERVNHCHCSLFNGR